MEHLALLEWLRSRAAKRHDATDELELAQQIFDSSPGSDSYNLVKTCAQKSGTWNAVRPRLLKAMRDTKAHDLLIRIHLAERELDEAITVLRAPGRAAWNQGINLEVARAAEKARPEVSLEIYGRQIEMLIKAGGRHSYKEACGYLKKMRELHHTSDDADAWEEYVGDILQRNARLSALREEITKARLIAPPPTPAQSRRAGA